ncbi:MAG: hypothetical protein U5L96_09490 [Owenweeksia sp.]|nr:hypothetical protein [Owenweeksia sp.]
MDSLAIDSTCFGTRTLNLNVLPVKEYFLTQEICAGQSYLGYSATGTYADTFTAANGCDSIRYLELQVQPTSDYFRKPDHMPGGHL